MPVIRVSRTISVVICWLALAACSSVQTDSANTVSGTSPVLIVLGVAQDAGYPQAGCEAAHCQRGWADRNAEQLPVALGVVDAARGQTLLFEATPALPRQLHNLQSVGWGVRAPLTGVFLTHAHIGHYAGLMYFGREAMGASDVPVYAMPRMISFLQNNGPWSQLVSLRNVQLRALAADRSIAIGRVRVTPFIVPHRDEFSETVGYRIDGPNRSALFIPDIDKWSRWPRDLAAQVRSVDYAFLDATFFDADELPGRNMAEIPHPFVVETMFQLQALTAEDRKRVWFIHFNHTNPLLDSDSAAAREVRRRGFNVSTEGLRFEL